MATANCSELDSLNLMDPETLQRPLAFYALARRDAPVYKLPQSPVPGRNVYFVSKYELIRDRILPDWRTFSSKFNIIMNQGDIPEVAEIDRQGQDYVETLLTQDPPIQRRYRAVLNPLFSPLRIQEMKESIAYTANALIDQFAVRGEADLLEEFTIPFPIHVIADQIGVPRTDLPLIKQWSDAIIAGLSGTKGKQSVIDAAKAHLAMQQYLTVIIDQRRTEPQEDIITRLVSAQYNKERPLTLPEILSLLRHLMVAGHETMTNALGGGLVHILSQPGLAQELAADEEKLAHTIEEILRLETSTKGMWRIVTAPTELEGVALAAGDILFLSYDAANRDETMFEKGDQFMPDRPNAGAHLSFGGGTHTCLGASLARMELQIALGLLLNRLPNLRITNMDSLEYVPSLLHRGLQSIHIAFDPVPA